MSAIRKLLETLLKDWGPNSYVDERRDAEAELKANEVWYDHLNAEVDKLRVQLAERDLRVKELEELVEREQSV